MAAVIAAVAALVGAFLAARLGSHGSPMLLVLVALLPVPVVLWRWPSAGVLILLAGATLIEQFDYQVSASSSGAFTDKIPFFHSLSPGTGVTPVEIFMVVVLLVWLMRAAAAHTFTFPRTGLARSIIVLVLVVVAGFALGQAHGGEVRIALWEVRPVIYLGVAYVLASSMLTTRRALRGMLWTLVLGSGFKAIQGVHIYLLVRHDSPRPEATLAHEEAFFFGLFIVLTLALWIFEIRGPLRTTATVLVPFVALANIGNSRRNAWAVLALTLVVLIGIVYNRLPDRRPIIHRFGVVLLLVSAVYFPAYWNHDGTISEPARALRSAIKPSARDLQSNQYRQAEDANLLLNIKESHSLGKGYGVPIDYAIPITDLTDINSAIAFIPHNGVLYIWMRLGILGEIVFLSFIGIAIVRACQLVKAADRELALLGTIAACAMVGYLVQGYNDLGFFWFRIAICVGVLLGAVEAGLRIARQSDVLPEGVR